MLDKRWGAQPDARISAMAAPIRRTAEAMLDGAEGDAVMADKAMTAGSATIEDHRSGVDDGLDRRQQAELMLAMPLRRRSVTGMPCSAATNRSYPSQRRDGAAKRSWSCSRNWGRHKCRSPNLAGHDGYDGHLCDPSETV
jgi:hypothetical protein